jgi:hypothetical protein
MGTAEAHPHHNLRVTSLSGIGGAGESIHPLMAPSSAPMDCSLGCTAGAGMAPPQSVGALNLTLGSEDRITSEREPLVAAT